MSSLINQHLLSQLFIKEHQIKNLRNKSYENRLNYYNEIFKDYNNFVELSKEAILKFPIESKLEVLLAIEIFVHNLNNENIDNNLIELTFYDASSGKAYWISKINFSNKLILENLNIQLHEMYRPEIKIKNLSENSIFFEGYDCLNYVDGESKDVFLNYQMFTTQFGYKLQDYGFLDFSNFKDLPMDTFKQKSKIHTVEKINFFPKYSFGINLSYALSKIIDHQINIEIGKIKMSLSIPINNISKRQISIKQFFKPLSDEGNLKLTISSNESFEINELRVLFNKRGTNSISSKFGSRFYGDLGQSILDSIRGQSGHHNPKVGLLCSINRRSDIVTLIQNINRQNYKNIKVIIIMNSSDLSKKDFGDLKQNVEIISVNESLSLGHCLNSGIEADKKNSDYFAKIDADDWYGSSYISDMVMTSKFYDAEVICKKAVIIDMQHLNQTRIKNFQKTFQIVDRGAGGTIFFKNNILNKFNFSEGLDYGTDYDFFNKLILNNIPVLSSDPFNYIYKRNSSGHTWNTSDDKLVSNSRLLGPSQIGKNIAEY